MTKQELIEKVNTTVSNSDVKEMALTVIEKAYEIGVLDGMKLEKRNQDELLA